MSGKTAEEVMGPLAIVGGIGATAMGQPEIGIPMLLGGAGMTGGDVAGGPQAGLMGGIAGAGAGMGAEAAGLGSAGIPSLVPGAGSTGVFGDAAAAAPSAGSKGAMELGSAGIKALSPAIQQATQPQQPPQPPQMPQRPQQQPASQATASAPQPAKQTQPMDALAQYHQFLLGAQNGLA